MAIQLPWLEDQPDLRFPPTRYALAEPNGLLCAGGDLSVERVYRAYQHGIFPWFSQGEPILWWSPNPRCVIIPSTFQLRRSFKKRLRQRPFEIRLNTAFEQVVKACAAPRASSPGTWILPEMVEAYCQLHQHGLAHSVECWADDQLVGGLYGVQVGSLFCGESMFSAQKDASKVALFALCLSGFDLIDCQLPTEHLLSMGATLIEREHYLAALPACQQNAGAVNWFCGYPDADNLAVRLL